MKKKVIGMCEDIVIKLIELLILLIILAIIGLVGGIEQGLL
jgi:hypothetical protein